MFSKIKDAISNAGGSRKAICIGLDHGNGFVKAKSDEREFILPSQLARAEEFDTESYGERSKEIKTYETLFDVGESQKYVWGSDVVKAKYPIKTYATEDRYTKLPYKLLSQFAMTELVGAESGISKAVVVTGVPSFEKGTQLEKELESVFSGQHIVKVNGREKVIDVVQVKVLPQPLGTLMYHYLDDDGYVLNSDFESDGFYCGVIDIGSGTVDLDGLRELQVQAKDRSTIKKGMFDAYDQIAAYIKEQDPRVDIDKEKVELWMRKKIAIGDNPTIYNPTRKINVDFTDAANRAFRKLAEDIIIEIDQRWNKSQFNEIYLTGGGAQVLSRYFREWDPHIKIVDDHQMANAKGFYRFAKYLQLD